MDKIIVNFLKLTVESIKNKKYTHAILILECIVKHLKNKEQE